MNFWASKLGNKPAAPPPAAPPASTSAPWWAYPATPGQQPPGQPEQPVEAPQELPPPLKAKSARQTELCPECGSDAYFQPDGHRNAAKRCFTCGYPVQHTTSGMSVATADNDVAIPTRQISTANNYNPTTIVGRIE